jgi:hypothetical protein
MLRACTYMAHQGPRAALRSVLRAGAVSRRMDDGLLL